MKFQSGEVVYTLKDIASIVSFSETEEGVSRTMRQIRHWTQNDLIQTVSEKSTGKGIPRFYVEEPTIQISGILIELSKCISSLSVLKPVAQELYKVWEGEPYLASSMTDQNAFLQVSWDTNPETGEITGSKTKFWDEMDAVEDQKPDPESACSILINMTQVMERVFKNKYAGQDEEPHVQ